MGITWKDGVTTLSTATAVLLERAYFHNWDLPLVDSMTWVIVGMVVLLAVGYMFSYFLDETRSAIWSWTAGILAVVAVGLAGLGLYFEESDYVVLLMINAVAFWIASVLYHAAAPSQITHSHA